MTKRDNKRQKIKQNKRKNRNNKRRKMNEAKIKRERKEGRNLTLTLLTKI